MRIFRSQKQKMKIASAVLMSSDLAMTGASAAGCKSGEVMKPVSENIPCRWTHAAACEVAGHGRGHGRVSAGQQNTIRNERLIIDTDKSETLLATLRICRT